MGMLDNCVNSLTHSANMKGKERGGKKERERGGKEEKKGGGEKERERRSCLLCKFTIVYFEVSRGWL